MNKISFILTDGSLFVDGKEIGAASIEMEPERDKHYFLEDVDSPHTIPMNRQDSYEFTATFSNRNGILSLFYGLPITNNWLKMHGGIMSRTKRRKRS